MMEQIIEWISAIDVTRSLLLLIALFGAYIAYQQWKTNRMKLRFELYEKRLSVYNTIMTAIEETLWGTEPSNRTISSVRTARAESRFLVPDNVFKKVDIASDMIELIYTQRSNLDYLSSTENSTTDEEIDNKREDIINREKDLEKYAPKITDAFMQVLKFNDA